MRDICLRRQPRPDRIFSMRSGLSYEGEGTELAAGSIELKILPNVMTLRRDDDHRSFRVR